MVQSPISPKALVVSILLFAVIVSETNADFVIEFDPSQTTVQSNGSDQTFSIDLLVTHDGSADLSTFSGFTLSLDDPGAGLSFPSASEVDFDFSQDPQVMFINPNAMYAIGASSNDTEFDVGNGLTKRLLSLDFFLDGSVDSGTFQLDLGLIDAKRGTASNGGLVDIASEVTLADGFFTVNATAVPEPAPILLLAILGSVFCGIRFVRKRDSAPYSRVAL